MTLRLDQEAVYLLLAALIERDRLKAQLGAQQAEITAIKTEQARLAEIVREGTEDAD